jgi:hypothetical protein
MTAQEAVAFLASKRRTVLLGGMATIAQSRNAVGKIGAKERARLLLMNAKKERHGAVEVADPDLGGASVEVQGAFFVDLGWGVRWGKDLDADFGRAFEQDEPSEVLCPARSEPGDIDGFDAGGGGNGAFREDISVREELLQEAADSDLAVPMKGSRRRTHKEVTVLIGLDAIGKLSELRVGQDLGPTSQVEPSLRSEIGKLNGDRHARKIRQK